MPHVMICILAHNNLALTRAAIQSAMLQDYEGGGGSRNGGGTSILVIDNASTDNTPQWLTANSGFSTVLFREQQSVAACWNYALDIAFPRSGVGACDAICMLNNDVEIRPDTVSWLMADPALFVTAVSVRSESELNFPVAPDPAARRAHPDFSCWLMKPTCWKKVGRFDEQFEVAFCEDNDMHVRMHMAGIDAICLDLPFIHHGSQTVKQADKVEQRLIQRAADHNRERFEEKWGCRPGSEAYNAIFQ